MLNSALYSKFAYILPYSLTIQESFCSLVNKPTFVRHLGFSRWVVQRHLPITNYSFIVCYMNSRLLNLCSAERISKTSWMTSCNLISLGKEHGRSQWKSQWISEKLDVSWRITEVGRFYRDAGGKISIPPYFRVSFFRKFGTQVEC